MQVENVSKYLKNELQLNIRFLSGNIFFKGYLSNFSNHIQKIQQKNIAWKLIIDKSLYTSVKELIDDKLPQIILNNENCINAHIVIYRGNEDGNLHDIKAEN
jgi:hypothetical protein